MSDLVGNPKDRFSRVTAHILHVKHALFFQYIHNLGVPSSWEFVDVYGLDPDLLMMVPRPVAAVMLLYPITEKVHFTLIITCLTIMQFSVKHGHVMDPKLIILLDVHSK